MAKLKFFGFLGEIFQTQTKDGWPDPARVKNFDPDPSLPLVSQSSKDKRWLRNNVNLLIVLLGFVFSLGVSALDEFVLWFSLRSQNDGLQAFHFYALTYENNRIVMYESQL